MLSKMGTAQIRTGGLKMAYLDGQLTWNPSVAGEGGGPQGSIQAVESFPRCRQNPPELSRPFLAFVLDLRLKLWAQIIFFCRKSQPLFLGPVFAGSISWFASIFFASNPRILPSPTVPALPPGYFRFVSPLLIFIHHHISIFDFDFILSFSMIFRIIIHPINPQVSSEGSPMSWGECVLFFVKSCGPHGC